MSDKQNCGAAESSCRCILVAGHEGLHGCDCGGIWQIDGDGQLDVYAWPRYEGLFNREEMTARIAEAVA